MGVCFSRPIKYRKQANRQEKDRYEDKTYRQEDSQPHIETYTWAARQTNNGPTKLWTSGSRQLPLEWLSHKITIWLLESYKQGGETPPPGTRTSCTHPCNVLTLSPHAKITLSNPKYFVTKNWMPSNGSRPKKDLRKTLPT